MAQKNANQYLEVQIRTASKEQLFLMLYDGAIRFCEQGRAKILEKDIEGSHNALIRAKQIVVELMCSLDQKVGDSLYKNLINLYNFIYIRLVDANLKKSTEAVDEAVKILASLRETWAGAIEKNAQTNGGSYAQEPSGSCLNMEI